MAYPATKSCCSPAFFMASEKAKGSKPEVHRIEHEGVVGFGHPVLDGWRNCCRWSPRDLRATVPPRIFSSGAAPFFVGERHRVNNGQESGIGATIRKKSFSQSPGGPSGWPPRLLQGHPAFALTDIGLVGCGALGHGKEPFLSRFFHPTPLLAVCREAGIRDAQNGCLTGRWQANHLRRSTG